MRSFLRACLSSCLALGALGCGNVIVPGEGGGGAGAAGGGGAGAGTATDTDTDTDTETPTSTGPHVIALASAGISMCALLAGGTVHCWGHATSGGAPPKLSAVPVKVDGLPAPTVHIAGNGGRYCAVAESGAVHCWGQLQAPGSGGFEPTPQAVSGLPGPATSVAVGASHACAIIGQGALYCWGDNSSGQLGTGAVSDSLFAPTQVKGISGVASVSAGGHHTCAIDSSGTVLCWGRNDAGQIGAQTDAFLQPTATPVAGLTAATAVAAGWDHTCALETGGAVKCWGNNYSGELADGTQYDNPYPTVVEGLPSAASLSSTVDHVCVALADGGARCWGNNLYGQVGNGQSDDAAETSPEVVQGLSGVAFVQAGGDCSCAALKAGGAKCWGANDYGQLGTTSIPKGQLSSVPVDVIGWP